jgi:hypothetical protein
MSSLSVRGYVKRITFRKPETKLTDPAGEDRGVGEAHRGVAVLRQDVPGHWK